jgi:hypothetical protein
MTFRRTTTSSPGAANKCGKTEREHADAKHDFKLDEAVPKWRGWHAAPRGLVPAQVTDAMEKLEQALPESLSGNEVATHAMNATASSAVN